MPTSSEPSAIEFDSQVIGVDGWRAESECQHIAVSQRPFVKMGWRDLYEDDVTFGRDMRLGDKRVRVWWQTLKDGDLVIVRAIAKVDGNGIEESARTNAEECLRFVLPE